MKSKKWLRAQKRVRCTPCHDHPMQGPNSLSVTLEAYIAGVDLSSAAGVILDYHRQLGA